MRVEFTNLLFKLNIKKMPARSYRFLFSCQGDEKKRVFKKEEATLRLLPRLTVSFIHTAEQTVETVPGRELASSLNEFNKEIRW